MASRLLTRLASRIAAARDPVQAACLRAQRGIYLARQGKHAEAQAIVDALRSEFGARPNAEVTAWISLVEALIHFYSQPGPKALDRLRRAHALSRAMNHAELVPLCAAWLAHIEFNANRMEPMLQYAVEALRLAQPEHHAALARASLVIADAFHFAGRFDLAKPWYAAVREHALAEGDDAMISAMLHNVAALRANQVRLAAAFNEPQPEEARRAFLEAESTRNYDLGIGTLSLGLLLPLVRAQLFMVQGHYAEAVELFSETLDKDNVENLERREASFFAERAWCRLQLGDKPAALADVEAACARAGHPADSDDLAATHARLAEVLDRVGERERSAKHKAASLELRRCHEADQSELLERMNVVLCAVATPWRRT
jgi:tetratricopeptide (TPR) repeat protein